MNKINKLHGEQKIKCINVLNEIFIDYISNGFEQGRFENSPHLNKLKDKKLQNETTCEELVMRWSTPILSGLNNVGSLNTARLKENMIPSKYDQLQIIESNDFVDLLSMGTEVMGSCFSLINGEPEDIRDLLGTVTDGKSKMVCIKDIDGKMMARTNLKILWDEEGKTPVLLQEGVYSNLPNTSGEKGLIEGALCQAAIKIAQEMGIPLVCGRSADLVIFSPPQSLEQNLYGHPIVSLDVNRAPNEKCDPLSQQKVNDEPIDPGGHNESEIQSGFYSIQNTKLIWKPN